MADEREIPLNLELSEKSDEEIVFEKIINSKTKAKGFKKSSEIISNKGKLLGPKNEINLSASSSGIKALKSEALAELIEYIQHRAETKKIEVDHKASTKGDTEGKADRYLDGINVGKQENIRTGFRTTSFQGKEGKELIKGEIKKDLSFNVSEKVANLGGKSAKETFDGKNRKKDIKNSANYQAENNFKLPNKLDFFGLKESDGSEINDDLLKDKNDRSLIGVTDFIKDKEEIDARGGVDRKAVPVKDSETWYNNPLEPKEDISNRIKAVVPQSNEVCSDKGDVVDDKLLVHKGKEFELVQLDENIENKNIKEPEGFSQAYKDFSKVEGEFIESPKHENGEKSLKQSKGLNKFTIDSSTRKNGDSRELSKEAFIEEADIRGDFSEKVRSIFVEEENLDEKQIVKNDTEVEFLGRDQLIKRVDREEAKFAFEGGEVTQGEENVEGDFRGVEYKDNERLEIKNSRGNEPIREDRGLGKIKINNEIEVKASENMKENTGGASNKKEIKVKERVEKSRFEEKSEKNVERNIGEVKKAEKTNGDKITKEIPKYALEGGNPKKVNSDIRSNIVQGKVPEAGMNLHKAVEDGVIKTEEFMQKEKVGMGAALKGLDMLSSKEKAVERNSETPLMRKSGQAHAPLTRADKESFEEKGSHEWGERDDLRKESRVESSNEISSKVVAEDLSIGSGTFAQVIRGGKSFSHSMQAEIIPAIMKEMERMRDNGRAWTRLSLSAPGGEKVSVHVKMHGSSLKLRFTEAGEELEAELLKSWQKIKEDAVSKGISLEDPEFGLEIGGGK